MTTAPSRPLDGMLVLDLGQIYNGPYCGLLLGFMGARVLKVEAPEGDVVRRRKRNVEPYPLVMLNSNKESVVLDLKHPDGKALFLRLVRMADVVVENFAPSVMARLGLDHAAMAAVNPGLVYCSISGFGQTGPLRERPAFAHIVQAISGLMHLERAEGPTPQVLYLQAADVLAGTHAFGAIAAALLRRGRTGQGAYIDVSMLETLVAAEDITFGSLLNGGEESPGPRRGMVVHRVGDGHVAIQTVGAPDLWARMVAVMERPDLAQDPRFSTPVGRRDNWPALHALLCQWLDRFASVDEALAVLTAARVPCAPVLSPAEVIAHPHLAARGGFAEIDHATRGTVRITRTPFHLDGRPVEASGPAPYRAGEHTREVLGKVLGYAPERVEELLRLGAVAAPA